jgi:hypothetical protein
MSASSSVLFQEELLTHIFSYLPLRDIAKSAAHVCKFFAQVAKTPNLWQNVSFRSNTRDETVLAFLQNSPKAPIESLNLFHCSRLTDGGLEQLNSRAQNSLKKLEIEGNYAFNKDFGMPLGLSNLVQNNPCLEVLSIKDANDLLSFASIQDYIRFCSV